MTVVSIAVMAHPKRAKYVEPLREALGGSTTLVVDTGVGVWKTAIKAWEAFNPSAGFHLVVQDDAVPCGGFRQALTTVLVEPTACHSLFFGSEIGFLARRAREVVEHGHTYIQAERLYWGVGIVLPTALIPDMLRWTHDYKAPEGWQNHRCDTRVSRFCLHHRIPVRYPLPSLLDHRDGPSLIGGYNQQPSERVAWWWRDGKIPAGLRLGRTVNR